MTSANINEYYGFWGIMGIMDSGVHFAQVGNIVVRALVFFEPGRYDIVN